ncbi:Sugar transporter protein [Operophtera brumata]|uniref:Sugar transporter protein n=1 Tax=Operophtera brumata TaxID=104452 RepID=A0A0L7L8D8_OPEBR|nr:Sugar transporter protein [Operophtera brumata]
MEDTIPETAALPGFSLIIGNFIAPSIMSKYGRRFANLLSMVPLIIGWVCIVFAGSIPILMLARFFHGICMGMCTSLGSLLIGEYTSPRNRGAFLMTISVFIAMAALLVHTMGSYFTWQVTALVCASIAVVDFFIVLWSPESPSWLAAQGRYEESKRVFRWLRGDDEETELKLMIEASILVKESKQDTNVSEPLAEKFKRNVVYFNTTIRKREFYRPIIIMMHIYTIAQWSGVNVMVPYADDLFHLVVGPDANIPLLLITLDIHRIIANIFAIYIIKKVKRRTMWFTTVGINIYAYLATAGYTHAKDMGYLPFDHPAFGILLTHILMFAVATGSLSLCFIIAGEIFPLEYKNLAGGISVLFYSGNLFLSVKTVPYLFRTWGVHGAYLIYASIISYCFLITWIFLPETKDRTLQDIEDEFRGRPLSPEELKSVQSLTSWKVHNPDRRCSTPALV